MSVETIVAIFDTPAHAGLAAADLREAGVPPEAIIVHTGHISPENTGHTAASARSAGFWATLFGGIPDHDVSVYERSVDDGASVLTVKAPAVHVARVLEIVESHAPIDIDDRAAAFAQSAALPSGSPMDGTRVVNRGGSRIRRFVAER